MNTSRVQIARAFIETANTRGYEYAVEALAAYTYSEGVDVDLLLRDIAHELEQRGQLTVELQSARKLSNKSKQQITDYLQELTDASKVTSTEVINPRLIGGVKAITSEYELDWTVRGRLDRLMKQGGTNG